MLEEILIVLGTFIFIFIVILFCLLMLKFVIWFGGKVLKIEEFDVD